MVSPSVSPTVMPCRWAVEHLAPGLLAVHQFVAHEQALRPVTHAGIQDIVADGDAGAWGSRTGGPELDHVRVIAAVRCMFEIVEMIALDQQVLHLGKIGTI
ncbi:MAG: hypothetical protein ACK4KW_15210 [Gemmobacter sp.]